MGLGTFKTAARAELKELVPDVQDDCLIYLNKAIQSAYDLGQLERDELKAQVELLQQAISTVRLAGKVGGFAQQSLADAKAERLAWMKLNEISTATPAQCLAEINAQAGRDGFVAGINYTNEVHFNGATPDIRAAENHANQLRQAAKAGE